MSKIKSKSGVEITLAAGRSKALTVSVNGMTFDADLQNNSLIGVFFDSAKRTKREVIVLLGTDAVITATALIEQYRSESAARAEAYLASPAGRSDTLNQDMYSPSGKHYG